MYDSEINKDYCKEEPKPEQKSKKKQTCVEINIFCDDGKKEPKDDAHKGDCKKDYKDEKKKDSDGKTCVEINIFCDHCKKEPKDDAHKGDCKKDY